MIAPLVTTGPPAFYKTLSFIEMLSRHCYTRAASDLAYGQCVTVIDKRHAFVVFHWERFEKIPLPQLWLRFYGGGFGIVTGADFARFTEPGR